MSDDSDKIIVKFCKLCFGNAESKAADEPKASPPTGSGSENKLYVYFGNESQPASEKIVVTLFKNDICACIENTEWIKWGRSEIPDPNKPATEWENTPKTEEDIRLEPNPTVTIVIPNSCLWRQSQVTVVLPDDTRNYYVVAIGPYDDPCNPGGGHDRKITENQPVPGCQLQVKHYFENNMACEQRYVWYGTGCLTGGRIVKANKSYGSLDITYDVQVQGCILPAIRPSDFVRWYPGDWVFLFHDACEDACDIKKSECKTAWTQGFDDIVSAYQAMVEEQKKPHTIEETASIIAAYEKKKEDICKEIAKHLRILPLRIGADGA